MSRNRKKVYKIEEILPNDIQNDWKIERDEEIQKKNIDIKPLTKNQEKFITSVLTNVLTIALGKAGVGRTYLSCGLAAKFLIEEKVNKIILSRPIIPCGGEQLGFLPGDSFSKTLPYFAILIDYLEEFMGEKLYKKYVEEQKIKFIPIAEMRGKNFVNNFVIVDECQNLNRIQTEMLLTRISKNCIMVLNGDPSQSDLIYGKNDFINIVKKLQPLKDEIGFINFTKEDIVRSGLVRKIIELLDD